MNAYELEDVIFDEDAFNREWLAETPSDDGVVDQKPEPQPSHSFNRITYLRDIKKFLVVNDFGVVQVLDPRFAMGLRGLPEEVLAKASFDKFLSSIIIDGEDVHVNFQNWFIASISKNRFAVINGKDRSLAIVMGIDIYPNLQASTQRN